MDAAVARNVAHYSHVQQRDRHGEPIVEHVARVVAAVPEEAQTLAWLHDVWSIRRRPQPRSACTA